MTGRSFASMVLAAMGCGLPSFCQAQSYGAAPVVTLPPEAGGYGGAYASPSFGDSGPGAVPAGYAEASPGGGYGAACPPQGYAGDCPPQASSHWPWKCRPLFISPKLLQPPRGSYVRLEYLLWEIEKPGTVELGAHVIDDPTEIAAFAPASDNTTSNGFPLQGGGFGYVPVIGEIQFRDNSGARLTFGVPLKNYGTIELSGWWLNQGSDQYTFEPRLINQPVGLDTQVFFPTTPLDVDGVSGSFVGNTPTGLVQVYDTLRVNYTTDLKGADVRYVVDAVAPPGEGFKLKPLFGFKYVGLQEMMSQQGSFAAGGTTFESNILSDTDNTLLGGTVGLRAELEHRWFLVGLEPGATFAGNISQATVVTDNLDFNGVRTEVDADYFDFSPILDLKCYARINCTENLRLHVGYDAFWLSRVYRPARVIEYNVASDAAGGTRADFDVKREDDDLRVEGLSVGAEFIF